MTIHPTDGCAGMRLDLFLAAREGISRSAAQKLIADGCVTVSGAAPAKNYLLRERDTVAVCRPEPTVLEAKPQDIPLDIVYEDDDIAVINKPQGMVVHPAAGNPDGTLVNALLHHCGDSLSAINGVVRPGIVHRIDRDTSGLLVIAKNDAAHRFLAEKLKTHDIRRVYFAIVTGGFGDDGGVVDAPIGRHPADRKRMAVLLDPGLRAREAVTHYTVLERFGGFTFLRLELETGRTHQIRVHMRHIGHPIIGDTVYGGGKTPFERHNAALLHGQCLHAGELHLTHPRTHEEMSFTAPLPGDFSRILDKLRATMQ